MQSENVRDCKKNSGGQDKRCPLLGPPLQLRSLDSISLSLSSHLFVILSL